MKLCCFKSLRILNKRQKFNLLTNHFSAYVLTSGQNFTRLSHRFTDIRRNLDHYIHRTHNQSSISLNRRTLWGNIWRKINTTFIWLRKMCTYICPSTLPVLQSSQFSSENFDSRKIVPFSEQTTSAYKCPYLFSRWMGIIVCIARMEKNCNGLLLTKWEAQKYTVRTG